jgi:hypothetical protein
MSSSEPEITGQEGNEDEKKHDKNRFHFDDNVDRQSGLFRLREHQLHFFGK